MLKRYLFILVAFAALCAWGIAPNWSDVSARSLNQSIPIDNPDGINPTDPEEKIPADNSNGDDNSVINDDAEDDDNLSLSVRPSAPTYTRGSLFAFIIKVVNIGKSNIQNIVFRFVVPAFTSFSLTEVQSASVDNFTCQDDGVGVDVCTYKGSAELAPGADESIEVKLMVDENYPDNGIDPLTLYVRVDGQNNTDGIYNTDRSSGTALDESITIGDTPIKSDDVAIVPPDAQNAPPATVDGNNTVSVPLGFINTSDKPLENVLVTAQLPAGAVLPEGSPWTCDENGTCIQLIGRVEAGQPVNAPFVFIGNNVNVGDEVKIPTRLDAHQIADDGVTRIPVQLQDTVAVQVTGAPTNIENTSEPTLDQRMFLPLIQTD